MDATMDMKIGFLGSGMMAQAIVQGLIAAGKVAPGNVIASDIFEGCRDKMTALGAVTTESNELVVSTAQVIILAVKPNDVASLLLALSG